MHKLKKILLNIDDVIASIALILIVAITALAVFMRYVIGEPLTWTGEANLALIVWFVFVGVASVIKRDGHIGIDYFVEKLPSGLKKIAYYFRIIINIGAFAIMLVLGFRLAMEATEKIAPILKFSYTIVDIAIPIGAALSIIHLLVRFFKGKKEVNS